MISVMLLVVGFLLLLKGAAFLVDGSSAIARRLKVSDLAIGLTVVAFGTSTPELFVNLFASAQGNAAIAVGNIVGSNIANVLFILGVSALIHPLSVTRGTIWKEIPFSLLAAILVAILLNDRLLEGSGVSVLSRSDGIALLAFFAIFLYYTAGIAGRVEGLEQAAASKVHRLSRAVGKSILGLGGLILGGRFVVGSAIDLGRLLGASESLMGLTVVAVGTSLPELATSAMAAYRKNSDIAVGNIVGSNIFNIFFILGTSATIRPLPLQPGGNADLGVLVGSSLLLFLCMFTGSKRLLDRWEGGLLLILYIGYLSYLTLRG